MRCADSRRELQASAMILSTSTVLVEERWDDARDVNANALAWLRGCGISFRYFYVRQFSQNPELLSSKTAPVSRLAAAHGAP